MKTKNRNKPSDSFQNDRERNDALNKSNSDAEKKLPGEYPPQEDIMNRQNMQRVGLDVENFSRVLGPENFNKPAESLVSNPSTIVDEPELPVNEQLEQPAAKEMERPVPKDLNLDEGDDEPVSESDVTDEDLQALGPKDLSMDMGEDEQLLKNRVWPVDMAGEDLDVPRLGGSG